MNTQEIFDNMALLIWIKKLFSFLFFPFLASGISIYLEYRKGAVITLSYILYKLVAGGVIAYFFGIWMEEHGYSSNDQHIGTFVAGLAGGNIMYWLHQQFGRKKVGETLTALFEFLTKKK